jgi:hypothetical protein
MNPGTPQEWGARGYQVVVAKYGERQMNLWRKRGGRKRNPTYAELMKAVTGSNRTKKAEGSDPSATSNQPMEG